MEIEAVNGAELGRDFREWNARPDSDGHVPKSGGLADPELRKVSAVREA